MLSSKNKFIYRASNPGHFLRHRINSDFYGRIYDVSVISETWKFFTIRKINIHLTHSKYILFYLFVDTGKLYTVEYFGTTKM